MLWWWWDVRVLWCRHKALILCDGSKRTEKEKEKLWIVWTLTGPQSGSDLVNGFLFSYFFQVGFPCFENSILVSLILIEFILSFIYFLLINIFLNKEDKSERNPWSIALSYSLHPTQSFFYITESGFSHLKRRLLHFPACLSLRLLNFSKPSLLSLPFSCCATERRRGPEEEGGGRQELGESYRGVKESVALYEYGGERHTLCLWQQNKGMLSAQRRSPHLGLRTSQTGRWWLFLSLPPPVHPFTSLSFLRAFQINRAGD